MISISRHIARIAVVYALALAGLAPARAAGLSADASCQEALALGVRRVAGAALKGIETCHRKRLRGQVAATVDCNDPSQLSGGPGDRLQHAAANLSVLANRRCDAATLPGSLGYNPCPAPCGAIPVGAYDDVGACLACLTQDRVRDIATGLFGTPAPVTGLTEETTCHAALARATRRYVGKRLRTQQQCRTAAEKGDPVGSDCRDGDYHGKISTAWAQLQARVSTDTSCPVASLVTLDFCPSFSDGTHFRDATAAIDLLYSCTGSAVADATNDLFDRVYAPGSPSPVAAAGTRTIASRWTSSAGPTLDQRNPRFRLIVEQTATVTLDLTSTTADTYLYLLNADGSVVLAEDDNGAGGSNSRIVTMLGVGRYVLVAATANPAVTGHFTIGSDSGRLKGCFFAYSDADYGGSSTLFCDGGTGEPFSNDTYSSLRLPQGLFVRAYENADRTGRAFTYYGDAPSLQPFFNNAVSSIEWGAFNTEDFFVVMVSDPQITWSYCSDNSGSALCTQEQTFFGSATEQEVALFYNSNLIGALNTIKDSLGPRAFGGDRQRRLDRVRQAGRRSARLHRPLRLRCHCQRLPRPGQS